MELYVVKILDINEEKLSELCLRIDSEKKYKIEKFRNKKDKIRRLIGEILIRNIIVKTLGSDNKDIKFDRNKYGKPYLKDYPEFNFSISYSGDYVLCAIDNKSIGVDIEEIKHIEYEEIARSFFSVKEFDYIINQNLNFQLNKFYEIWTLKESYVKCCGQGLSIPLKSFTIEVDHNKNIRVVSKNGLQEYTFKIFDIELGYKIAVCSLNKEITNNILRLEQNDLINNLL